MHNPDDQSRGFLRRTFSDPLKARRAGALLLLVFTPVTAFAHAADGGFWTALLAALCWLLAPGIASAIGYGEAFFIQYGRHRRRTLLTLIGGVLLALASCVVLAGLDGADAQDDTRRTITEAIGYGMLYLAVTISLASLIAVIIGFGKDYISERIMRMSSEDW